MKIYYYINVDIVYLKNPFVCFNIIYLQVL